MPRALPRIGINMREITIVDHHTTYTNCVYFLGQLKSKYAMVNAAT
jgi:hypothetical protein